MTEEAFKSAGDEETAVIRYERTTWLSGKQERAGMLSAPDFTGS